MIGQCDFPGAVHSVGDVLERIAKAGSHGRKKGAGSLASQMR